MQANSANALQARALLLGLLIISLKAEFVLARTANNAGVIPGITSHHRRLHANLNLFNGGQPAGLVQGSGLNCQTGGTRSTQGSCSSSTQGMLSAPRSLPAHAIVHAIVYLHPTIVMFVHPPTRTLTHHPATPACMQTRAWRS